MTKDPSPLQVLADADGSITLGWVGDRILYASYTGSLSAELGQDFARQLETLVKSVDRLRYFADASALKQYDLLARSAFVRVVLANRRKFEALSILTWSEGLSPATRALAETLGSTAEILEDVTEFYARLFRVAPSASYLLGTRGQSRDTV